MTTPPSNGWMRPKTEYRFGLSEKTAFQIGGVIGVSSTVATTVTGLHFVLDGFKPRSGIDSLIGLALGIGVFWLAAKVYLPVVVASVTVLSKTNK